MSFPKLTDYLGRRAVYSPERLAAVDYGKTPVWRFTYGELNERANRLANWLQTAVSIQPGDRIAILARDGVEHLDCFFACAKLGAIHTALNWRLHERELAAILEACQPRALIFSGEFGPVVAQIQQETEIAHYLHIEGESVGGSFHFESGLGQGSATAVHQGASDPEAIAALIFTGGSTGHPKAVQISHRMIGWNSFNTVIHDLRHDDVYLNVFPLFHTGGLFVYTMPQIIMGGTVILTRQFDPAQTLDIIGREKATVFAGVPTMYQLLAQADNWAEADLSSLRFCTSGGAPLPVSLVERYTAEKGVRFKQGFGMTEFGPGIFALAAEDAIRKAGSIGRPNFFVEARVVGSDNQPLGPDEVGELLLRGPSLSSGYFGAGAAVDADGWFHTGDLARYDNEHYFFIVDRKKDMFISGGENVYPAEIEAAIYQHPAVQLCAVVGLPDPQWGEIGLACVVLKAGRTVTADDLLAHLQSRLARYKIPRRIEFVDNLPLSGAGKILKRELRQRYKEFL
jgi:fatty-acyl-CoA synthase